MSVTTEYNDINAQMQSLIRSFDVYNETVASGIVNALNEGADIIVDEQKARVPASEKGSGIRISTIGKGSVFSTKKGNYQIKTGFFLRKNPEALFAALITEFGRPGKKNKEKDSLGRKIGAVESSAPIRRGFDAGIEKALQKSVNLLEEAAEKWMSTK